MFGRGLIFEYVLIYSSVGSCHVAQLVRAPLCHSIHMSLSPSGDMYYVVISV